MNLFKWLHRGSRAEVPEEPSNSELSNWLQGIEIRLDAVEKKAEATRRKVYRDGEVPPGEVGDSPPGPQLPLASLNPGDEIPANLLQYMR